MTILVVHAQIKPEYIDAFIEASRINAANSLKEPAVARFELLQQNDDPSRFVLYEVYNDPAGPAAHKETAHYNAWLAKVNDMFVTPRSRAFYTDIAPASL